MIRKTRMRYFMQTRGMKPSKMGQKLRGSCDVFPAITQPVLVTQELQDLCVHVGNHHLQDGNETQ